MAEFYLGEIRLASFSQVPNGWALCNGQLLPVSRNQALFALLGTAFGGDGVNNFALPNLQGRTPIGVGPGYVNGQSGGEATHQLTISEMPGHTHTAQASSSTADSPNPNYGGTGYLLAATSGNSYLPSTDGTTMNAATLASVGSGQGHSNMQPFQVVSFIIATTGVYPSRA